SESGISFDPRVVEVLQRRYVELENLATQQPVQTPPKLSTDIKVARGLAPDAGFAESEKASEVQSSAQSNAIAAVRRETQGLLELRSRLGSLLTLDDLLALLLVRARRLMSSDSIAIYAVRNKVLVPEVVSGENFRLFSSLRIPVGEGLSGWVAENAKPILNGNPSVEPGYLNDPSKYSTLRSALAVPLQGASGVVAVLALYRVAADAFSREELDLLQTAVDGLGLAIEGALPREMKAAHAGAG
ncbi:MAG: GAF domain-containing protein, partial [Candidatus Sulfotelmatobacter sp.]